MSHRENVPRLEPLLVVKQIYVQKFRYATDGRSGLRNQDKEFMNLKVNFGRPQALYECIVCCVDEQNQLHPHGLQGRDCRDGLCVTSCDANNGIIRLPHLQIERKKKKSDLCSMLTARSGLLPELFQEKFRPKPGTKFDKFDANKVRLCIIVREANGSEYATCVSDIISNEKESCQVQIKELSNVSAEATGGVTILICTSEDGPEIKPDGFEIYMKSQDWQSALHCPCEDEIMYKRVIRYTVLPYWNPNINCDVTASLVLRWRQGKQESAKEFTYKPNPECVKLRKRKAITAEILHASDAFGSKVRIQERKQPTATATPGRWQQTGQPPLRTLLFPHPTAQDGGAGSQYPLHTGSILPKASSPPDRPVPGYPYQLPAGPKPLGAGYIAVTSDVPPGSNSISATSVCHPHAPPRGQTPLEGPDLQDGLASEPTGDSDLCQSHAPIPQDDLLSIAMEVITADSQHGPTELDQTEQVVDENVIHDVWLNSARTVDSGAPHLPSDSDLPLLPDLRSLPSGFSLDAFEEEFRNRVDTDQVQQRQGTE